MAWSACRLPGLVRIRQLVPGVASARRERVPAGVEPGAELGSTGKGVDLRRPGGSAWVGASRHATEGGDARKEAQ